MTLLSASQAEAELRHVAQQFSQWRQRRTTPRGRIPQPLWTQAVALTHVLPLSQVAKRLGLCPQRLRQHRRGKAGVASVSSLPAALPVVAVPPAWRSPTALHSPPTGGLSATTARGRFDNSTATTHRDGQTPPGGVPAPPPESLRP
jgi:hypothetical protein